MVRARVVAVLENGEKQEAEGSFAPLKDRILFESHFGISAVVMGELDAEKPDPKVLREEWVAFLSWRLLARKGQTHDPGTMAPREEVSRVFHEWLETVEDELEVEFVNPAEIEELPKDGPPTES